MSIRASHPLVHGALARVVPLLGRGGLALLAQLLLLDACGGGDSTSPSTNINASAASITVVSGSGQSGIAGSAAPAPIVVRVVTAAGLAVNGATVSFAVTAGNAIVSPTSATTDANGQAQTTLTLGSTPGAIEVTATVSGTSLTVKAVATSQVAAACTGATSLAAGQVTQLSGSSVCLTGAAGAEYALVAYNASTDQASTASLTVLGSGTNPVTTPVTNVANAALGPLTSTAASASLRANLLASPASRPRHRVDFRPRALESRALLPRLAGARRWYNDRRGSLRLDVVAATPAVGSIIQLNADTDNACAAPTPRAARVIAVSNKAIIVADTLNPAGGYTTADLQSVAATFDTLVDPVDTRNFGQPTDINGNGRIILFFTRAVNELTPANASFYVAGFFFSRDLFPTTDTPALQGCAGSNVGEIFYLMVPDPNGVVHGNKFSKTFVTNVVIATVAHEYQHLINASRRVYVNTQATDFEVVWLDEGLSHVAEELTFYASAASSPRLDLNAPAIRASTIALNAFNEHAISNFDRLAEFLDAPSTNSPYADNDSLATRGATWSFLRWAVDHQTAPDATIWFQLVNSGFTGFENLQATYGADLTPLFRDWATSLLMDDLPAVDVRYQQPSWNFRSLFAALESDGSYPLNTGTFVSGTPLAVTLNAGGAAYLRFGVSAGSTGLLSWGSLPAGVQLTLVRLR